MAEIRDQEWLENTLADIWYKHFSDIHQHNEVIIRWGRKAKNRLGSISQKVNKDRVPKGMVLFSSSGYQTSMITINKLLQQAEIPDMLVRSVIFHELSHYAHGFNSPFGQKYRYPHRGGVMRKEFEERGCLDLYLFQKKWLKDNWWDFINRYY